MSWWNKESSWIGACSVAAPALLLPAGHQQPFLDHEVFVGLVPQRDLLQFTRRELNYLFNLDFHLPTLQIRVFLEHR